MLRRILLFLPTVAASCQSLNPGSFHHRGLPVHPVYVRRLTCDLDAPRQLVVSVDLEAYATADIPFHEKDGALRYEGEVGYFNYRHIGSTPMGTHVLLTAENTGGSGVFMNILLVRLEEDTVFEEGAARRRSIARCVGAITLGDRDDGEVTLLGNKLLLGRSRYRSRDCEFRID